MFMHKSPMEIELKRCEDVTKVQQCTIDSLRNLLKTAEWDLQKTKDVHAFEIDKARFEKAKEMEKALIESDIRRVSAEAKLETYVKMDTKEEREHIRKMLDKAITSLGNQKVEVIK